MPLGMDVGLGPGDFAFDGAQLPPEKSTRTPPIFWPMCIVPNGWMDQDATWYGDKCGPGDDVLDGIAAPPAKRGRAPSFRFMSIVAKRLDG